MKEQAIGLTRKSQVFDLLFINDATLTTINNILKGYFSEAKIRTHSFVAERFVDRHERQIESIELRHGGSESSFSDEDYRQLGLLMCEEQESCWLHVVEQLRKEIERSLTRAIKGTNDRKRRKRLKKMNLKMEIEEAIREMKTIDYRNLSTKMKNRQSPEALRLEMNRQGLSIKQFKKRTK